jgi:hypothetical protein
MTEHFHIQWQAPRIVRHVHPFRGSHVHEGLVGCTTSKAKAAKLLAARQEAAKVASEKYKAEAIKRRGNP